MEKNISVREWATVKRIAQSVAPMVQKKEAIQSRIKKLAEEYRSLQAQIDGFEGGIRALCCGLSTEDLVHREVTVMEGRLDKDGRPQKKVSYEPNSCARFDKDKGVWMITIPDTAQEEQPESAHDDAVAQQEAAPAAESVSDRISFE